MIGIVATVVAKVRSRRIDLYTEAYIAGSNLQRVKDNPEELQALIDSLSPMTVDAMHQIMSEDSSASAFDQVKWPVR